MIQSGFRKRLVRLMLLSLALLFSASSALLLAQPEQLNQDLVGYWRFDEGAGAIARDETSFRNDGQVKGPGWVLGLIQFGLDYYGREDFRTEVPHAKSLAIEDKLTLACWVCLRESLIQRTSEERFYLFAKPDTGVYGMSVAREDRHLQGSVTLGGSRQEITSEGIVPTDRWVHTAFTYDTETGEARLYIDGRLDRKLQLGPGRIDVNTESLFLGSGVDVPTGKQGVGVLPGVLDEARIYQRVLSEEEVAQLAGAPTIAPTEPCGKCYAPPAVAEFIAKLPSDAPITQAQFLRGLFMLLNRSETLSIDAPIEEIVQFLSDIQIIPQAFPVDLEAPITKGAAALLLLRALELQVPFLDQLLITVGLKQAEEAALAVAVREGLILAGRAEDLMTGRDFVNLGLFLLERLQVSPPSDFTSTDVACALLKELFLGTVVPRVPPPGS